MKRTATILILLLGVMLFAQETNAQKELLKRAEENFELINTNPEKAFQEAIKIEKEARRVGAKETELRSIIIQCAYFKRNNDFENMMINANHLFQRAEFYKNYLYQIIAKRYLFDSYNLIGLPQQALQEIEIGKALMNQLNEKDSISILTKADLLVAYSNYYYKQNDINNQLKYMKLSGRELEKLPDSDVKKKCLFIYYSNLASVYIDLPDLDSAKYYAKLSLLNEKKFGLQYITYKNLYVLGNISQKEKKYKKALVYFKKAEKLNGYKDHLDIEDLYSNIIQTYSQLQQKDSVKLYEAKKDSLKLTISESQNKVLHKLLSEERKNNNDRMHIYILILSFMVITGLIFFIVRKKALDRQEIISQEYLKENPDNQNGEDILNYWKCSSRTTWHLSLISMKYFLIFLKSLLILIPKSHKPKLNFQLI